jgi:hypothetical protein
MTQRGIRLTTNRRRRLWDKIRALEMLAKHFALFKEVVHVETDEALVAKLLAGRKRVAAS